MSVEQLLFARCLNDSLASAHFSPEELVRILQSKGYLLRNETLNSWRRGESIPRDYQAFQIAACMENAFGVQRGTFCESLLHDLFPVRPFISDDHIAPEPVAVPESDSYDFEDSYSLTEDTDWAIDSHRLVVKDEMKVSADCKTVLWNTIIGSLVPPVSNPSVEVGVQLEKDERPYLGKFILDTYGARIGKETCVEHGGAHSYKASLMLTNPDIVPGEIAFCSFVRGVVSQKEQNDLAWRVFKKELDYYSCTILFEGQAPRFAEYVTVSRRNNREPVVTPLDVQNNRVKVAIRNFGQAGESGYIRYIM